MIKRILALPIILLVFTGCGQMTSVTRQTIEEKEPAGVRCSLSDDGTLTIRGQGVITSQLVINCVEENEKENDYYCVKKIDIQDGITGIEDECFYDYLPISKCTSVQMADSVTYIGDDAFACCEEIQEFRLSNELTKIGSCAFENCYRLKKLVLPKKLKHFSKDAICGCGSLAELENQSAYDWELCTDDMGGSWYCDGKKVKKVPAGRTATVHPYIFPLTYDLNGGTAYEKLPEQYNALEGCEIPNAVKRKGYMFVGWFIDDELTNVILPGTRKREVRACWINLQIESTKKGSLHCRWNVDVFEDNFGDEIYDSILRYSDQKDMSSCKYTEFGSKKEIEINDLKSREKYYIEYAVFEDLDDYDTLDELPWQGKQSIIVK